MFNYHFYRPANQLSPYINYYWSAKSEKLQGLLVNRITPTGFTEITFHFGEVPARLNSRQDQPQPMAMACGLFNEYFDLKIGSVTDMFSVVFRPAGMALFFKFPISAISHQSIALSDLDDKKLMGLYEQLKETESDLVRIRILEKYLTEKLIQSKLFNVNRLQQIISTINNRGGQIKVAELADIACLSKKQLQREFTSFVGVMPKEYLKIIRFQSALWKYEKGKIRNLSEFALDCGYYDQAHFIQDFKKITGYAPARYFKTFPVHSDYFESVN